MINTKKIKPLVLPVAIVLGLILHGVCETLSFIVPYMIFAILILTFSTTDLKKLRFEKLDLWLVLLQSVGSFLLYYGSMAMVGNTTISEGIMLGALCPVASSVTVIATMLGAGRENTIAYTIIGNLLICILAPILFVLIDSGIETSIIEAFISIFGRISVVIGLPFFVMLILQRWCKPVVTTLSKYSGLSFYIWALTLLLTLGQTIDMIFKHGEGNWREIVILGISSMIICPLQFLIGRFIGKRCGDAVAGQQLLAQKNSAMGIWMANTYLNPLASTFLAFYSIWQNVVNSIQIWFKTSSKNQS